MNNTVTLANLISRDSRDLEKMAKFLLKHIEDSLSKGLNNNEHTSNYNTYSYSFSEDKIIIIGLTIDERVYEFNFKRCISQLRKLAGV